MRLEYVRSELILALVRLSLIHILVHSQQVVILGLEQLLVHRV